MSGWLCVVDLLDRWTGGVVPAHRVGISTRVPSLPSTQQLKTRQVRIVMPALPAVGGRTLWVMICARDTYLIDVVCVCCVGPWT